MSSAKPSARFFPTLTEVVQPGIAIPQAPVDVERLTQQVVDRVRPRLEQQLRANLQSALDSYLRAALPQYRAEMDAVVESVVAEAMSKLSTASPPPRPKG